MLKNSRNLLWLLPLMFFVISPVWIPGVRAFLTPLGGFDSASMIPNPMQQKQQFVMDDITITMSAAGRVEWIINAERAYTVKSDKVIGMIEVDAQYIADDEQDRAFITSRRGRYNLNTKHLTLRDDVVILKPAAQQEMYTDLLHYYNKKQKVVCPGDVELRGPDFTIEAGRLDYDLARRRYDFRGRVNVELSTQNKI